MRRTSILLLGDSISLGYRDNVRYLMGEYANVLFPKEQGKFASDIYRMLYEWTSILPNKDDVKLIYWNAGLWDVVRIMGDKVQTSPEVYCEYLSRVYERLRHIFPSAKQVFALTTRVAESRYSADFIRYNKDIIDYNKMAISTLNGKVDAFDDLFEMTKNEPEDSYVDATHFKKNVNKKIGKHVSEVIRNLIEDEANNYLSFINRYDSLVETRLNKINNSMLDIICWGSGNVYNSTKRILSKFFNIRLLVDRDKTLWGSSLDGVLCKAPNSIIGRDELVVITLDNYVYQLDIKDWCADNGVLCCSYTDLLPLMWEKYEDEAMKKVPQMYDVDPAQDECMKKYIGIDIKENNCNLDCDYCYLSLDPNRRYQDLSRKRIHNPKFLRYKLSRAVLGGSCLIGLTGTGETMLVDGINELCFELLKEGHYLHIVTNGTIIPKTSELLELTGEYSKNIIFKLSFHYLELKKRGLLSRFTDVVDMIEKSPASYTIEIVPYDGIDDYIDEIAEFSVEHFGAYPHLTIARDESNNTKLLSNKSFEKYVETWEVFESNMFSMRTELYMMKGVECLAGPKAFFLDYSSGTVRHCVYYENLGNLYLDKFEDIDLRKVGRTCPLPYCFNCHVYATLGVLPLENIQKYSEIRDRVKPDGSHWIKKHMRDYLGIKLYKEGAPMSKEEEF